MKNCSKASQHLKDGEAVSYMVRKKTLSSCWIDSDSLTELLQRWNCACVRGLLQKLCHEPLEPLVL